MTKHTAIAFAVASVIGGSNAVYAQETADDEIEVIQVRGILSSLKATMRDKKDNANISDGITAEDLGKFPDQNVAESLQRITGVSIDRSSGEGQYVTVRGFGPRFNSILVNGRQMATENAGRQFSFDTLAAEQITGSEIYKSPTADMQEGSIGATINVKTARPFDFQGFKAVAVAKGAYDTLSGELGPQVSGLVTNTMMDGKLGVLLSVAQSSRNAQSNIIETRYYRPNVTFTTQNGDTFNNAYVPQNFDLMVDEQERTRTNMSTVVQFAPSDELTLTFDGLFSNLEVDSDTNALGHWFSESNFIDADVDDNNSVVYIDNANTGATDFIHRNYSRDVSMSAFGLNVEYVLTDAVTMTADLSSSSAEDNSGGNIFFNVIGYNNAYTWDNRSGPSISIEGGEAAALRSDLGRAHYNERNGWDRKDEITEARVDFEWITENDTFASMRWGIYSQSRKKDGTRKFVSDCGVFCGYGTDVPDDLLTRFEANGFWSGVPNVWLSYDVPAYDAYRASAQPTALAAAGIDYSDPGAASDAYTVEEDILSAYFDFSFEGEIGDLPWALNTGFRYSKTDSVLSGITRELVDLEPIAEDPSDLNEIYAAGDNGTAVSANNSYTNILPSMNLRLELTEDALLRLAYSETMTRPIMEALNPAVTITVSRPNNNQAAGGNPELKPFVSSNWDFAFEWYYEDSSMFTAALFSKEVEDFIVSTVENEDFVLESGVYTFGVNRPRNSDTASVTGVEVAWTHAWDNGFGIQTNATIVDSDTNTGALEGLGDSQNVILFYEDGPIQARIAYNNRESFLQFTSNPRGGTEPVHTEAYGQWDISASYDIQENITVFIEGVNITEEETRRYGRYKDQLISLEDNGSRWAIGVRANY